jgi:uncharacterized protein YjbI with pentapeptide repeats
MFTTKKKFAFIVLLILALLFILGNYNREVIKSYIDELVTSPSIRVHLINIAKVAIPLKNFILMRNLDDKITLLKTSGSCIFCDLTQGNFKGSDLRGVDLRYSVLIGADFTDTNLTETDLTNTNLTGAKLNGVDLSNKDLTGVNLTEVDLRNKDLTGVNFSRANLSNQDFTGAILAYANLKEADLSGANLSNQDFTGTILTQANLSESNLTEVNLSNKDLTGVNLSGVNLSNKDLTRTVLVNANLSEVNLDGVDLSNKDLTGVNLTEVDLRYKDLTGVNFSGANLSNQDFTGAILTSANLTGANLSGVDLSNQDLTETTLKDAKIIKISIKKNTSNSNFQALNDFEDLNITRFDLNEDKQYLATKEGFLFESKNANSQLVLDLNNDSQFPFTGETTWELGLLGVASKKNRVYISYTSQDSDGSVSLVVDEYSENFTKVRNIIKIPGFSRMHIGGALQFDSLGRLYLSVGDGSRNDIYESHPQNLNDYRGKILRLDISNLRLEPEIIAYGIRNAWGLTIDSKDRMFITQCGFNTVEAVYLISDLYSGIPANFGWPIFEGSLRLKDAPLKFNDLLAPIFETRVRPGCLTDGVFLDDLESFLFADFYGTIRLLKEEEDGEWYLLHQFKQEEFIWGFGLDKKTKKVFIIPNNLELEISVDQVKLNQ